MGKGADMLGDLLARPMGLGPEWEIVSPGSREAKGGRDEPRIRVAHVRGQPVECPECGRRCGACDTRERGWRHLDIRQPKAITRCAVPRCECGEHGARGVSLAASDDCQGPRRAIPRPSRAPPGSAASRASCARPHHPGSPSAAWPGSWHRPSGGGTPTRSAPCATWPAGCSPAAAPRPPRRPGRGTRRPGLPRPPAIAPGEAQGKRRAGALQPRDQASHAGRAGAPLGEVAGAAGRGRQVQRGRGVVEGALPLRGEDGGVPCAKDLDGALGTLARETGRAAAHCRAGDQRQPRACRHAGGGVGWRCDPGVRAAPRMQPYTNISNTTCFDWGDCEEVYELQESGGR